MNNFFRAIIAGWGAKKLGGGCLSTIVIFIIIYVALGQCNERSIAAPKPVGVKIQPANIEKGAPFRQKSGADLKVSENHKQMIINQLKK